MKFFHFLFSLFLLTCNSACQTGGQDQHLLEVQEIKEDLLEGYYCIFFESKDTISLLISVMENDTSCANKISIGNTYYVELEKVNAIRLSDGITWRLYVRDLYIDGELILPRGLQVFSSPNVWDLCVE